MRLLFIDGKQIPDWKAWIPWAETTPLPLPSESHLLNSPPPAGSPIWEECRQLAMDFAHRFDYVLAECTGGFLWHCLFRLAGDDTPFVLIPRFNQVYAPHALTLFLSSQLRRPGDRLFCGSAAAARSFRQFGFDCHPRYLPGLSLNLFPRLSTPKAELCRGLELDPGRATLLYTGRMADDKSLLELLDVFEQVDRRISCQLVVCHIFTQESYLQQCLQRASGLEHVHFVSSPPTERLIRYYNAADLFVSTAVSAFETFGRSPVEAMACGTPPVVAEYDGFRETVPPSAGFLVPTLRQGARWAPDVPAFTETIVAALSDRAALEEKARNGPEQAWKFAKEPCLQALRDSLEADAPAGERSQLLLPDRVSLDGYPAPIQALWSALDGQPIAPLIENFIRTWKIPAKPAEAAVRGYYESWFAHY